MRPRSALAATALLLAACTFQPGAPRPIDDEDAAIEPAPPDLAAHPDLAQPDLAQPDLVPPPDLLPPADLAVAGRWYQADKAHCPDFCARMGLASVASPDLASCASGEVRPASAIQQGIRFTFQCWGACTATAPQQATTVLGGYCYALNQGHDWDETDITVGCFCR